MLNLREAMDQYLSEKTDWLFTPMETYIPVSRCPVAVTIYDIQAFETDLPWSNTRQHRWFRCWTWITEFGCVCPALLDFQNMSDWENWLQDNRRLS